MTPDDSVRQDAVMYPVTIVATRYGGTYEGSTEDPDGNLVGGGRWAAFNCFPDDIPADAFGGDIVAAPWWAQYRGGSGPHPADHPNGYSSASGRPPMQHSRSWPRATPSESAVGCPSVREC